jgi:1-acyl-sn-glycerol-3-phosphate acyltransferase
MAFDVAEGFPLWQWLIRVLAKSIGCVFIYRDGRTNINSVKKILSLLQKGECIFITPEGDRSSNKALMKAYNGAAYAAIKTGANIAPIASYGYEDIYQNILNRRKTKLYVIFGGAIAPAQMKGNYDEITECLMRRIALMLPPHYRGNYN